MGGWSPGRGSPSLRRGSGLPPVIPTIPTVIVAVTAMILAFILGHATAGGGGGSPSVASVPDVVVTTTTSTTAPLQTVTIAKGDTLASIAAKYGVTADALQQENAITDPSKIFVGQTLRIPPVGSTGTTTTTKKAAAK